MARSAQHMQASCTGCMTVMFPLFNNTFHNSNRPTEQSSYGYVTSHRVAASPRIPALSRRPNTVHAGSYPSQCILNQQAGLHGPIPTILRYTQTIKNKTYRHGGLGTCPSIYSYRRWLPPPRTAVPVQLALKDHLRNSLLERTNKPTLK